MAALRGHISFRYLKQFFLVVSDIVCVVSPINSKMEVCVTVFVSDIVCVVLPIYSKMELCVTVIVSADASMYDDFKPTSFLLFVLNDVYLVEKKKSIPIL